MAATKRNFGKPELYCAALFTVLLIVAFSGWGILMVSFEKRELSGCVISLEALAVEFRADFFRNGAFEPEAHGFARQDEDKYYDQDRGIYFFPAAWQKPGRILFAVKCRDLYVLMLGDGAKCVVKEWLPLPGPDLGADFDERLRNKEFEFIIDLKDREPLLRGIAFVPAAILAFLLSLFIARKLHIGESRPPCTPRSPDDPEPSEQ